MDERFVEWKIPVCELTLHRDRLLGKGTFADVYLATWRGTTVVAKCFNNFSLNEKSSLIEREIDIMTKLHHPNIVQILGYVDAPFIIVMEYIRRGDLLHNLTRLWLPSKISIMRDCLQSLCYLHNRKPESLMHRDIKLSNILLTNSKVAKLADFGLSRLTQSMSCPNSSNNLQQLEGACPPGFTSHIGTERYKAPEMPSDQYTNKIDVYALGIAMYELFEAALYMPSVGLRWRCAPSPVRRIIVECMLRERPCDRCNALTILERFNHAYPESGHRLCSYFRRSAGVGRRAPASRTVQTA